MIELARKKPDFLNAAINVAGSTSHLSAEMFKQLAGVKFTTVPYKGGGLSLVAVMGGEVDFQFAEGLLAAPQLKAGKVRALAVSTPDPSPFFPGLPTMTSLLPGFVSDNWFAMYFPAGTPGAIVATMNATVRKALATETVRGFAKREVLTLVGSTPEELGAFLKSEIARYGEVIRKGNITIQ
jgi:tripartite-type tricarboxylate transporter receptor subunit TctC